ncbi:unnamed protein product [Dicrocoelium dendriticum]|nr:unnamed protein product [Dicrocoelium dendriticum]
MEQLMFDLLYEPRAEAFTGPIQGESADDEKRGKTFLDLQNILQFADGGFGFDKNAYRFKKEKVLIDEVVQILTMPSAFRTPAMLQTARVAVLAAAESFADFPLDMQTQIISRSWYERYESRRVIIRQGQPALNFYFIISGTAAVSVSRKNRSTGEPFEESVAVLKPGLLAGLWEFPSRLLASDETTASDDPAQPGLPALLDHVRTAFDLNCIAVAEWDPAYVGQVTHLFSHIRMTYVVQSLELPPQSESLPILFFGRWISLSAFESAPVSTATRKIFAHFQSHSVEAVPDKSQTHSRPIRIRPPGCKTVDAKQLRLDKFLK